MICKRGDLVLVPFPFTDLSATKQRPVLLLSDTDGYGDFTAAAVTSRAHHSHAIDIGAHDLTWGVLPSTSWVRTDRIVTLNVLLVRKTFGAASESFVMRVVQSACNRIGLAATE